MKSAYIFLADGFEEIEGLTAVDLLRRAGVKAVTVSVTGQALIHGAHGINVEADCLFEEMEEQADLLVLPGGMPGTLHLKGHEGLRSLLMSYDREEKWIAAICAAPSVFADLGILKGRAATSYPTCLDGYEVGELREDKVVVDGHIITSRGLGTAIPFALALITVLCGQEKADEIASSVIYTE